MNVRHERLVVCLVMCLAGAANGADQESVQLTPADTVLKALKPLSTGFSETYFFEHSATGRKVGCSELSLTVREHEGKQVYEYRHLIENKFKANRSTTVVTARLTPQFHPLEIQIERRTAPASGVATITRELAVIEGREIVLTTASDRGTDSRRVPLPKQAFAYGMALLMERIDFDKFKVFMMPELDPKTGKPFTYKISSELEPDGKRKIRATWGAPDKAYHFDLDKEGRLEGWGQVPPAVEAKRITADQFVQLKKSLGLD